MEAGMSIQTFGRAALVALATAGLGGCDQEAAAPAVNATEDVARHGQVAPVPVTLEWQEQARNLVADNRLSALAAGRVYAAVSVAQAKAVLDVGGKHDEHASNAPGGQGNSGTRQFQERRGAVAGASVQVLSWFFPAAADALEQKLAEQAGTGHPQFERGVSAGRAAGDEMIAHLMSDGFTAPWTGTVPVGPGLWIPTTLPPAGVMLGSVKPYVLESGAQFRPAPPPAFLSPAFNQDLDEVVTLTQNITPEQLEFARYWDFPGGTPTPIGYWNGVAAEYVEAEALDERAATRVFAVLHAAMFDALIACWEAKYYYWTLRPSQANPAISLALTLPNFPSYPSGHSCASASAGRVLAHFFPDRTAELDGRVSDAGLSRILAGIHYRFDITAGQELGRKVADWTIAKAGI